MQSPGTSGITSPFDLWQVHVYVYLFPYPGIIVQSLLLSGGYSYDEMVYVWDTRNMSKPLKEVSLRGGVWRIKWCPLNSDLVAAACMHNGFQVIRGHLKTGEPMEVVSSYSEHESLAYGVDWCQLPTEAAATFKDNRLTLASCSFYDHSLHIWSITM